MRKLLPLLIIYVLSVGVCLANSLPPLRQLAFFKAPVPVPVATNYAGAFTLIAQIGAHTNSSHDALSDPVSTIGANFAVATTARADGPFTFSDSKANTWIAAFSPISNGAWPSNQIFYCTNFVADAAQTFTLTGGGAFNVIAFSCNGTAVFLNKSQAGNASSQTFNPGSLSPHGTNLFVAGLAGTNGAFTIDATFLPGTLDGYFQEEPSFNGLDLWSTMCYKFSNTAENPTFTEPITATAGLAQMVTFGSVAASGVSGIAEFKLNGDLTDATGNGHNAALASGSAAYTTGQDGLANHAFVLDGTASFSVSDTSFANFTSSDFSVSFWLYDTGSFATDPVIISKGVFAGSGYFIQLDDAGPSSAGIVVTLNQAFAHQTFRTLTSALAQNTWYNIVIARSGTSGKIFINGVDATSASDSLIDPDTDSHAFLVGGYSGGGLLVTGVVDDVTVFNSALTVSDALALYLANAK